MKKLLKLSIALLLIGSLNHSAISLPVPSIRWKQGYISVPGQSNVYQQASYEYGTPPLGFVTNLPAGAKIVDPNSSPAIPAQPTAVARLAAPSAPIASPSLKPVAAPIVIPALNPASVQWMPYIYYRYPDPGGSMIYVNDNNGVSYLQHPDGTKTDLPPVPKGQFLRRSPQYQLPIWLRNKWTQDPADNGEYFVKAGNGNNSNRIISKGPDGALQVRYITQNQWIGRNGVVHQVTPVSPATLKP